MNVLAERNWFGTLIVSADQDGRKWVYHAYGSNKLTLSQARNIALCRAMQIRKGSS